MIELRPWSRSRRTRSASGSRLAEDVVLQQLVSREVDAPPEAPSIDDILEAWVDPPRAGCWFEALQTGEGSLLLMAVGEQLVLEFERARLISRGKERLARSIEHVALTRGEGAGLDILSYEE